MRVFLDTNVLVSAFATRGLCADVMRVVLREHTLVTGTVVVEELERVLVRKLGVAPDRARLATRVLEQAHVEPRPRAAHGAPGIDLADRWVLASARAAEADVIVTGDRALLALRSVDRIPIVSPRGFWTLVKSP